MKLLIVGARAASSMQRDFAAGVLSELANLNGVIVARAAPSAGGVPSGTQSG